MRHDVLASLFQSTREFLRRLQDSPLRQGPGCRAGTADAAAAVGAGGKLQLGRKWGTSDTRLWVYTGVTVVGLEVSKSAGPYFLVGRDKTRYKKLTSRPASVGPAVALCLAFVPCVPCGCYCPQTCKAVSVTG